jgi:hypothetical protein
LEKSLQTRLLFRKKDLQGLGTTDLSTDKVKILALVVRHFVPLLSNDPAKIHALMASGAAFNKWMTASDLALAILILEHHIVRWRSLILCQLENGDCGSKNPAAAGNSSCSCLCSQEKGGCLCCQEKGLLHKGGIGGESAKIRFEGMSVNFYHHLTNSKDSTAALLHTSVQDLIKANPPSNLEKVVGSAPTRITELQDSIIHRVFFYMHFRQLN